MCETGESRIGVVTAELLEGFTLEEQQQLNEYLGRIARNMERVVEKEPEQDKTGLKTSEHSGAGLQSAAPSYKIVYPTKSVAAEETKSAGAGCAMRGRTKACSARCPAAGFGGAAAFVAMRRRVEAAHVEHGIRGESSAGLPVCTGVVRKWGVPLHVIHLDVPAQAAKEGRGIEETARAMRHDFLWKTREARRLETLATAHHLNDQAETVLMHLIRGASPVGLSGMRERDGALIRPLLPFSRAQIEQYAQENHLPHVEDETNADIAYTRNYIRHELIPCMEKLNPRAVEAIGRAAGAGASAERFRPAGSVAVLRSRMYGAALADVSDLHPGLRSEVIAQYLRAQGTPEFFLPADIVRIEPAGWRCRSRVSLGKELFERDTNGVRRVIMEPAGSGRWALHSGEKRTPLGRFTLRTGKVPKNLNLGKYARCSMRTKYALRCLCAPAGRRPLGAAGRRQAEAERYPD